MNETYITYTAYMYLMCLCMLLYVNTSKKYLFHTIYPLIRPFVASLFCLYYTNQFYL